jgi:hypothetical protein
MCLQFGFVIFGRKDFGAKAAHKMLVKLTPEWHLRIKKSFVTACLDLSALSDTAFSVSNSLNNKHKKQKSFNLGYI